MTVLITLATFPFPIFLIGGVVLLVIIARWYFSNKQVVKRSLKQTPLTDIEYVKDGDYVRIQGEVRAIRETIKAPLTGRRCVYYSVKVRQKAGELGAGIGLVRRRTLGMNDNWTTIVEEEVMADVILTNGKHYVMLECDQPRAYLVADGNYNSGFMNDAPKVLENYLKKYGHTSKTIIGANASTEYFEGILEEGEFCTVKGHGYWVDAKKLKVKFPVDKVLVIREKPGEPLYLSDDTELEEL